MDISKLRKKAKAQQAENKLQAPGKRPETIDSGQQVKTPEPVAQGQVSKVYSPEPEVKGPSAEVPGMKSEVPGPGAIEKPLLELAQEELKKYPATGKEKELLCFALADQEYAIELGIVREIIRVKEITPVPNTSDFVLGIIVLRGDIIPVIDLRKRIGLQFLHFTSNTRFIMVSFADAMTGLVVDSIPDVKKVSVESIQPAELVGSIDIRFLDGISTSRGGFTILLKLEEILKQSDMLKG